MKVVLLLAVSVLASAQNDPIPVVSPDGQIELRFFLSKPEDSRYFRLAYQVSFHGKLLIDTSLMGLVLQNQEPILGENLGLTATVRDSGSGYNSLVAQYIQNGSLGRRISVEARAYNDGVAFRYYLSKTPQTDDLWIEEELTDFKFAQDGNAYAAVVSDYQSGKGAYKQMKLSGVQRSSLLGLPLLVEQPGAGWVAITQAQVENFPGTYLFHPEGTTIRTTLTPRIEDAAVAVHGVTPADTPWRVLMVASEPRKLLQSNIVLDLNPPPAIRDSSWIKPAKEYVPVDISVNLDRQFAELEQKGVGGVKIDLLNRTDQQMIEIYRRAAKIAADHHLMVQVENGPLDGIERTWPNVLTREDAAFRRLLESF